MQCLLRAIVGVIAIAALGFNPEIALAQAYPAKPIRLIFPFPPGGPTDLLGRAVAQKLSDQMGQPVVADTRPGAGGNLGLELAAKALPDGYTLVLSSPLVAISPSLYAKLNYDPAKDLAPVSLIAVIQNVVLVHPSVPAKTLKELIALARATPGKLNYGSGGVGTTTHLAPELLQNLQNIKMVHVPYKGSGLALIGLIGGDVDLLIMAVPAAASQIHSEKVRALAVLAAQRSPVIPAVPTAKEAGVDKFEVPIWYGILAPAATPRDIITRLNSELVKALTSADLKERLAAAGIEPMTSTPEQAANFIRSETVRYAAVIKAAVIKPE
ncbi:MAG TPA: tripartite tricarboxylate transporter substrate binding protein [Burkholderiales bacterium]|nr:tripartite tricarboxylate transporter substrate binding protein [Burkholderiales bacterium]